MQPLLLDLVQYAQDAELVTGDGEDAFRDFMPEKPDNVVVFSEYESAALELHESVVERSVQVIVRNSDADASRQLALALCRLFHPVKDDARIELSNERWAQIYVRQTPFKLKQDESNRIYYCFNLGITTSIE